MGVMDKPTQSENKIIGATYERNRFEVHYRRKGDGSPWFGRGSASNDIEGARARIAIDIEQRRFLRSFIDLEQGARYEYRIVKVTATCEVVE